MFEEQLFRIKQKHQIAKRCDRHLKVFGASSHKYVIGPPLSETQVQGFETEFAITLPPGYRAFLTQMGNGGKTPEDSAAGPFYGIYPLGKGTYELLDDPKPYINRPAQLHPDLTSEQWTQLTRRLEEDDNISDQAYDREMGKLFAGILPIGSQGCTYIHAIVLTGDHRGRVVNLDLDLQKPHFAYEPNFLDWYERWLDEVISGVLLEDNTAWFGYSRGGDDRQLFQLFDAATNSETKAEALEGMTKLVQVSPDSCRKLAEICQSQDPKLSKKALQLLVKFDAQGAEQHIQNFIQGDDENCKAACQAIWWYDKANCKTWFTRLQQRLPTVQDEDTFSFISYILLEGNPDCGKDLEPFCSNENESIRTTAFFSLGQVDQKAQFLNTFIQGLNDNSTTVVRTTLQALEGIPHTELVPAYKKLMIRYKDDQEYILSNLKHRLKEMGKEAEELLQLARTHPNTEFKTDTGELLAKQQKWQLLKKIKSRLWK